MRRRIAVISEHASPLAASSVASAGRQSVCVAHSVRALAALGYDIDVFTRRDDPELPAAVRLMPGVRVVHIEAGPARLVSREDLLPTMSAFAQRVLDIATRARDAGEGYSLVHAHFFMSGLVARRLRDELGLPYVVSFHGLGRVQLQQSGRDDFPRERATLEQLVIDDADAVIAASPQEANDLLRHYEVYTDHVVVIPHGFSPEELVPVERGEARRRLGLPVDRPIVLQLGRLVSHKGVDSAIRALAIARAETGIDALLVVVGGNADTPDPQSMPELSRLMQIARDEGVSAHVRFVGRRARSELRDFYCAADVFVAMPTQATFGVTALEAMACKVPVIGSRSGGIPYLVQEGQTGFLVEPNEHAELARTLAQMLREPKLAALLGRRGQRYAYRMFTWQQIAQQLDALFTRVERANFAATRSSRYGAMEQSGRNAR